MHARYVSRPDEQAFAPPYLQAGCSLYAFAPAADRVRLQQVVDRFVTEPSRGRVRPRVTADHVLLYFCEFARSHSLDPRDAARGWLGEREVGVWIPIRLPESQVPSFFVHAMFVDSGPAMCSGREVLGFPKQLGHIGQLGSDAPALTLDVLAQAERRDQPGRWRALIELERVEPSPTHAKGPGGLAELLGALGSAGALLGADTPLDAAIRAGRGECELVNLKQIRDASDPTRACYQAIIGTRARLLALRRVAPTRAYALRIEAIASHPLAAELGLAASEQLRGLALDLDFDLGLGRQLGEPS